MVNYFQSLVFNELQLLRAQCRMGDSTLPLHILIQYLLAVVRVFKKKKIDHNFYMLIMSGIYDDGYDDFGGGFGGGGYGRSGMGRRGGMNVLKECELNCIHFITTLSLLLNCRP